jgi:hypothetical protein
MQEQYIKDIRGALSGIIKQVLIGDVYDLEYLVMCHSNIMSSVISIKKIYDLSPNKNTLLHDYSKVAVFDNTNLQRLRDLIISLRNIFSELSE